ncbi:MAG: pyridoxine 5'-phosphate synthase [bacterium]|nr:pyridoxine 5'-phosphate synthase [bacterium]
MKPRVFVSLEPVARLAETIPDLDDLDIAYVAARSGASGLIVANPADGGSRDSLTRFDRPGLPLLCVHASLQHVDNLSRLGNAPDRFLISDDGRTVQDFHSIASLAERLVGSHQEVSVLIEPDPQVLKNLIRARVQWVVFATDRVHHAASRAQADDELARLNLIAALARKSGLRVMLYGPVEQHLAPSFAQLEAVEELVPLPTLWQLALRHGWENSLNIFDRWLR